MRTGAPTPAKQRNAHRPPNTETPRRGYLHCKTSPAKIQGGFFKMKYEITKNAEFGSLEVRFDEKPAEVTTAERNQSR